MISRQEIKASKGPAWVKESYKEDHHLIWRDSVSIFYIQSSIFLIFNSLSNIISIFILFILFFIIESLPRTIIVFINFCSAKVRPCCSWAMPKIIDVSFRTILFFNFTSNFFYMSLQKLSSLLHLKKVCSMISFSSQKSQLFECLTPIFSSNMLVGKLLCSIFHCNCINFVSLNSIKRFFQVFGFSFLFNLFSHIFS